MDNINNHSFLEKALHTLAFSPWASFTQLANLESRRFKKELDRIEIDQPVFITALPRAGTTLLLQICVQTSRFGAHTYADMPFVTTPVIWNRFASFFRHVGASRERVHGDGMLVNTNSPESFEEVIWKGFWPSRYRKDHIVPWDKPSYPEFEVFFRDHIKKIILLRSVNRIPPLRYVSKNNLNIARIRYLKQIFPDATIIVPFRDPVQQASSLLRQHRNFINIHQESPFARKYMEDTGHFDFGMNLRPIAFDNWIVKKQGFDVNTLSFWLEYWWHTYNYLLVNAAGIVHFFSYDAFCQGPENGLELLARLVGIENQDSLKQHSRQIISPKQYAGNDSSVDARILGQTKDLYLELSSQSK